jgi:hypothetical protein
VSAQRLPDRGAGAAGTRRLSSRPCRPSFDRLPGWRLNPRLVVFRSDVRWRGGRGIDPEGLRLVGWARGRICSPCRPGTSSPQGESHTYVPRLFHRKPHSLTATGSSDNGPLSLLRLLRGCVTKVSASSSQTTTPQ